MGAPPRTLILKGVFTKDNLFLSSFFCWQWKAFQKLTSNASSQGHFHCFKFDVDLKFELLQFADDTIVITGESLENIWSIKAILSGFGMTFGMSVNYDKRNLFGVNINASDLHAASLFLVCKIGSFLLISLEFLLV